MMRLDVGDAGLGEMVELWRKWFHLLKITAFCLLSSIAPPPSPSEQQHMPLSHFLLDFR
jgi:hypothetical protein